MTNHRLACLVHSGGQRPPSELVEELLIKPGECTVNNFGISIRIPGNSGIFSLNYILLVKNKTYKRKMCVGKNAHILGGFSLHNPNNVNRTLKYWHILEFGCIWNLSIVAIQAWKNVLWVRLTKEEPLTECNCKGWRSFPWKSLKVSSHQKHEDFGHSSAFQWSPFSCRCQGERTCHKYCWWW